MAEGEKPGDTESVMTALRLGWQVAELRGRFWHQVNAREPVRPDSPALTKEHALPLEDERTPLERLYETESIVSALAGQVGLDFPVANLSGQGKDPDQHASARLVALTRSLSRAHAAGNVTPAAGSVPPPAGGSVPPPTTAPVPPPAAGSVPPPAAGSVPPPAAAPVPPADGPMDHVALWDDFAGFLFAWDARIQDALAAVSFSQSSAYQLGRGLAEISWELDPAVAGADDPHGWLFLLGESRRRQLSRLVEGLSSYFGPMTVAAVKDSLQAWGTVAQEPGITGRADAETKLIEQSHVWRNLLIGGMSAQTLVPAHPQGEQIRGLELVLRAFWPQVLIGTIGVVVLAVGAYFLATADFTAKEIGAALGVLGSFGITSAAVIARSKESVSQVFNRMRTLYYTDLVSAAASRVPIMDGGGRQMTIFGRRRKKHQQGEGH